MSIVGEPWGFDNFAAKVTKSQLDLYSLGAHAVPSPGDLWLLFWVQVGVW
eukprot:CAMPEP_0195126172 /NCGR_PEP_ID=MMETSP0448-20130528/134387_1 /TAXON_ID=66468 /ORGANISM="Heterocapsa triquestra, Strain CCMP 448" /LENGTH=49 /DNA_ID= /DNA_START= /DNA_END= /DNA_ORIENTATION=